MIIPGRMKEKNTDLNNEISLLILGNQAGDLDSTVCTLSLGTLLSYNRDVRIIPLLRGISDDLYLKPEILALLDYAGIKKSELCFHHNPTPEDRYFLVDHNVPEESMPALAVWGIIDHHQDSGYEPSLPLRIIEPCGSCASLVCREWYERGRVPDRKNALLLAAAIIVDTENFDPAWGKTTEIDLAQYTRLEKLLSQEDREFLKSLPDKKYDLHALSLTDYLRRDYKDFRTSEYKVGISTVPLSIQDFFSSHFYKAKEVEIFIQRENLDLLFIMHSLRNPFSRELSFRLSPRLSSKKKLHHKILKALSALPDISLSPLCPPDQNKKKWVHYSQGNRKASRKILLPLFQAMMEEIARNL